MTLFDERYKSEADTGAPTGDARSRRRFIQGLGAATPLVVLTAHSPSVLARECLAPSAQASIALHNSRPDRARLQCNGANPSWWVGEYKRLTHWNDANPPTRPPQWPWSGASPSFYSGFNMNNLLFRVARGEDVADFRLDMTAAYLNRFSVKVPPEVIDYDDLTAMWNGRDGTYSPTAGVMWGRNQIRAYLATTWN